MAMISWILPLALSPIVFALSPYGHEFIGKCLYYQTTINPGPFVNGTKNCSSLWESFRDAVAFQSPCHVPRARFTKFVSESQHDLPQNKFIFWEDVYDTVMRYSNRGRRTFSIADTLTGFLGDTQFCGSNSSVDGMEEDRSKCPGYEQIDSCPWSAEASFWAEASEFYAKSAKGIVELMLNSSSITPVNNDSYFSRFELPYLMAPRVTGVRILFAQNSALPPRETCSGPTVEFVKRRLDQNGVRTVTCEVNPSSLKFQLCSENPSLPFCTNDCDVNGQSSIQKTVFTNFTSVIFVIIFLYICI
uniref:ADP-ribosyl cyclase/cyclic ADP-ribose hydrolase-like n=1 Tax=Crassostrea virginica TaxID=6565 RepID=A0A8B8EF04_CRAVI|nr:ADP-ribosyl cyclase/cyclic ADP-ribose hydrolase-like [Crassostrea virginica]